MNIKNKSIPELCDMYSHEKSKEFRAKEQATRIMEEIQKKNRQKNRQKTTDTLFEKKPIPEKLEAGMRVRLKTGEEARDTGWRWRTDWDLFYHSSNLPCLTESMLGSEFIMIDASCGASSTTGTWNIVPEMVSEVL